MSGSYGADDAGGKSKRARIESRNDFPGTADIRALIEEAQESRGCLFEQWYFIPGHPESFIVTVAQEEFSEKPIWTLYQGEGGESRVIWSAAEADVDFIADMFTMFMTPPTSPLVVPAVPVVDAPEPPAESVSGMVRPGGYFESLSEVDMALLKQNPNILLGHLLVEAGFLTEVLLDYALKLQEMVRNDSMTPVQAIESLKRQQTRQSLTTDERAAADGASKASKESMVVIDLLKQAGLLTEDDVQTVLKITRGKGDLDQVLVAAQKIDKSTLDAAKTCWPFVRDGRMKPEQAIIALHYCQRMRVSFAEAVRDMGWEMP